MFDRFWLDQDCPTRRQTEVKQPLGPTMPVAWLCCPYPRSARRTRPEPFIGSTDAVTRYLSIPPQSQSEWPLISQLKLISVPG
jgi:hypothetical protein